ncbi:MAG: aminopeptidase P family protein [Oscillibacter sp.]|jgi:Xaa-Pro aminopeptidase|nr:aminopeptidase P family protein [Oscillibacter sp.]
MNHFAQIAAKLEENGLDAMLLTEEANRLYASGFRSYGTDGAALITKNKTYYLTDFRYIEAVHKHVENAEITMTTRERGYTVLLEELVQSCGLHRVGFDDAYMTVADGETYHKALSCELVGASGLLRELRAVKDAEELESMIAAQRIAERALDDILKEIHPGVAEKEIAARLTYLMLHYGAENMSFDPIVVSGPNGSLPHGVPSQKKIERGEFVTMDFGCIKNGYCSDMTRTVAVGEPSDEMRRVYDIVARAQKAGIDAARGGVTGKAVDGAARKVIEDAGYGEYFGHSFGHSLGVEIHEAPNAAPMNDKPLPVGATISAEPGIYLPGRFGVRIEDVILLREDGCEDITRARKDLVIL